MLTLEVGTVQGSRQHRLFRAGLLSGCCEPVRPDLELQPASFCLVTAGAIPGVQNFTVVLATRTCTCALQNHQAGTEGPKAPY